MRDGTRNLTEAVVDSLGTTTDPRLRALPTARTRHLHAGVTGPRPQRPRRPT
ncbi:hypothetical protein OG866_05895 [Streptomyces sp. NBC_00663]|uniref:hypothetical protein n=1 Tax=Streptomyces sp. NBC_00663 TaxID=2975801 RepID=UPI002E33F57C|nr:hypothetical protein [Streptomyces sp. NBC_00663]